MFTVLKPTIGYDIYAGGLMIERGGVPDFMNADTL